MLASIQISEDSTAGAFFDTTGGYNLYSASIDGDVRDLLVFALILPNCIYGLFFLVFGMASDKTNAYAWAMVGNLITLTASLLFRFKRTPITVIIARVIMAFGESILLPQGLRFASYNCSTSHWKHVLAMWLYATANVELAVVAAVSANVLRVNPDMSFNICTGISALSMIVLVTQTPTIGISKSFWKFWQPFARFLDPMIPITTYERGLITKITNSPPDVLDEDESKAVYSGTCPTATLYLYATDLWARLHCGKFDYLSPLAADISLCLFGLAFGALAFTGVGLPHQAQYLPGVLHRLAIFIFFAILAMAAGGLNISRFRSKADTFKVAEVFGSHFRTKLVCPDYKFLPTHFWDRSSVVTSPDVSASDVEIGQASASVNDQNSELEFLERSKTFKSILSGLFALLASLTAFFTGINVVVTIIDATGRDRLYILLTALVSPVLAFSYSLALQSGWMPVKYLRDLAAAPRIYLTGLNFLSAFCSLILSQIPAKVLDTGVPLYGVMWFWSTNALATFTFLIYIISDEYKSVVGVSTAALDYVVQLAFIFALFVSRLLTSAVEPAEHRIFAFNFGFGPRDTTHADAMEKAQRCLAVIMMLQLVAALITLGGIHITRPEPGEPGVSVPQTNDISVPQTNDISVPQTNDIELETLSPGRAGPSYSTPDRRTHAAAEEATPETFESQDVDTTPRDIRQTRTESLM